MVYLRFHLHWRRKFVPAKPKDINKVLNIIHLILTTYLGKLKKVTKVKCNKNTVKLSRGSYIFPNTWRGN